MNSTRLVILSTAILRSKLVSKSAFLPLAGDFLTSAVGGLGAGFLNEDDNRLRPPFFLTEASFASLA
jgi:hypothetical protein